MVGQVHVKYQGKKWRVILPQMNKPIESHENKFDAIQRGVEIAYQKGTKLIVHNKDGTEEQFQAHYLHDYDPYYREAI